MQATLFGQYCAKLAELKSANDIKHRIFDTVWDADDFFKSGFGSWKVDHKQYEVNTAVV